MSSTHRPPFPHVYIRFLTAVFQRREVEFVGPGQGGPIEVARQTPVRVECENCKVDEALAPEARAALTASVREFCRRTEFRAAIVFAAGDVVYVGPGTELCDDVMQTRDGRILRQRTFV